MCKLCKYIPAYWSPSFLSELQATAQRLGTQPDYILAIIKHESNFNTRAVNSHSKAVGLIQFMPSTYKGWLYTQNDILSMNELQQLQLIEKYYRPFRKFGLNDPYKLFAVTFYPYMLLKWNNNNWVIGSEKSDVWARTVAEQNRGFDLNKNGYITVAEYKKYHKAILKKYGLDVSNNSFGTIAVIAGLVFLGIRINKKT